MTMVRQGVSYAGEFELVHAMISSKDGKVRADLLQDVQITELNIFENMYRSAITGSIIITDMREIITKFPFIGQEIFTLKIKTPSPLIKEKIDIIDFTETRFIISNIALRGQIGSGAQVYDMTFVSEQAIVNNRKRISKSYVKVKSNIGEMVRDLLLQELGLPQDKIFIDETIGTRSLVMGNVNPHTFINTVAEEAISKKHGSPHYVFFENKNGLFFTSLQELYDKPTRGLFHAGDKATDEDYLRNDPDSGKVIQSYRRILDYTFFTENDLLLNSKAGMIGGKVIEHNLFRKKLETKTFNYFDDNDYYKYTRIEGDKSERTYTDIFNDVSEDEITNSRISVIPISKDINEHDMYFELKKTPNQKIKTVTDRQSRFIELNSGIGMKATIHGYTGLAVGDIVTINLPTIGGDDDDGNINEIYSGDYLIQTLRHTFSLPVSTHTITMDVVKDGLRNPIEPQS